MSVLTFIEEAFGHRPHPVRVVSRGHPPTEIYADAEAFAGKDWREITCQTLDSYPDAIFGLLPEAFCYFLPGMFSAGIREARPDLLVYDSLMMMLDRGNAPASWDDFFLARWPKLTRTECEATQKWILWLSDFDPPPIEGVVLSRAYDTMDLLARQSAGVPIAGRFRNEIP